MWYIGIDVHKKMCNACIKDLDGNIQKELENSQRRALEQTSYLMLLTEEKQKQ